MDDIEQLIYNAQLKWGKETVKAMQKEIKRKNLIYKNKLYNSIAFDLDKNNDFDFTMVDYGLFQDLGVKGTGGAGESDSNYQFRGNWQGMALHLKEWANSKGINPYAAAHSIQKKGIKPKRFFHSIWEAREPLLGEAINRAIEDGMDGFVEDANNDQ